MDVLRNTTPELTRDLVRADVELLWWSHRSSVVSAVRNFAAQRFIRLPVGTYPERVVEKPLRDLVNEVGRQRALTTPQRRRVYIATLLAVGELPLGMGLASPFDLVDELDRIVGGAPRVADAVQQMWTTVDDPRFWIRVARRGLYLPAA